MGERQLTTGGGDAITGALEANGFGKGANRATLGTERLGLLAGSVLVR